MDYVRYHIERFKNKTANEHFRKENPNVALPPDYLIYESFTMSYHKYYSQSFDTTKWLVAYLEKYIELKDRNILDWGCGPGRIIRHLPEIIGNGCKFYGTDYNPESIAWCSKKLSGISFNKNSLNASLPYSNAFFDVIYGISIFTHLSEKMHYEWYNELMRILKPGGILFLTTQGNNFKSKLIESELEEFRRGKLVVRGKVKEGHRTFSAFQPKEFMYQLFNDVEILEHVEIKPDAHIPQDIWIVKK